MYFQLLKVTNLMWAKLHLSKKIREKASIVNSASKAHMKYQDTFALLDTHPKWMENKPVKVYAKDSAVFNG